MNKKKSRLRKLSETDKKKLYEEHIGLMIATAKRYFPICHVSQIQDLTQEAWFALVDAAEYFNEAKRTKFSTYAVTIMERRIQKYINIFEKELRTPAYIAKDIQKYIKARKRLEDKNEKEPSLEELKKETGLSMNRIIWVAEIVKHIPTFLHINQFDEDESSPLEEFLADKQRKFKKAEEIILTKEVLLILQECLTPEEIYTIRLRLGLNGNQSHTFKEMGEIMRLSRERPRQIYEKAIKKLQRALKD